MGQQHQHNSNLINNWVLHPQQPQILINLHSRQQIQRHHIIINDSKQLHYYSNRMHELNSYICRIVYFHQSPIYDEQVKSYFVYTDRMLPILQWRFEFILMIFKGFRRLFTTYGPVRIQQGMIGQNQKGIAKLWLNSNPIFNYANKGQSEQQMLADLVGILMHHDKYSAASLMGCHTFNDAIKSLNRKKQQDKSTAHKNFSYRFQAETQNLTKQPNRQHKFLNQLNNHDYWTIRGIQQRGYISQGKKRLQFQKNANSSIKYTQNSLGKTSSPTFVPSALVNQNLVTPKNFKGQNSSEAKNTLSTTNLFHKERGHQKQVSDEKQLNKQFHQHRKKYISTYSRKIHGQSEQTTNEEFCNHATEAAQLQAKKTVFQKSQQQQFLKVPEEKGDRMQTFNDLPSHIKMYSQSANVCRNRTQQFDSKPVKSDIPNFIYRKKQISETTPSNEIKIIDSKPNLLQTNHCLPEQKKLAKGSDIYQYKGQRKSGNIGKKQYKSEKSQDDDECSKQYRKNQSILKNKIPDLDLPYPQTGKNKKFMEIQGKNSKKITNSDMLGQKQKQQKINPYSSLEDKPNDHARKGSQDRQAQNKQQKFKQKQQMAKQLKMQFGSILSWGTEQSLQLQTESGSKQIMKSNNKTQTQSKSQQLNKCNSKGKLILSKTSQPNENSAAQQKPVKTHVFVNKYTEVIKDQLIKQKVQKKKAAFAELKKDAAKLLGDD